MASVTFPLSAGVAAAQLAITLLAVGALPAVLTGCMITIARDAEALAMQRTAHRLRVPALTGVLSRTPLE